jgi:hypothetical protein
VQVWNINYLKKKLTKTDKKLTKTDKKLTVVFPFSFFQARQPQLSESTAAASNFFQQSHIHENPHMHMHTQKNLIR